MSYHISNLGAFSGDVTADINGYVPTADTTAWDLSYDHGTERTHDDDGNLTEYGEWFEGERFPEIKAESITATEKANEAVAEWRDND